jgi:hypothetical protein
VGRFLDQERERDGDPERRKREVEASQSQSRDPEQEAGDARHRAGDGDRPEILDAVLRHQDRSRVRADAHEGAVAQRDLAAPADQQVQAQHGDEIDRDDREL